jgi:hypothetical protein
MAITICSTPFHRRAVDALNQLSEQDQNRIKASLAGLANVPWERWPTETMRRLAPDSPLYLFRAGPELRLILQPPEGDGRPTVLDVVRQETLASFARS